MVVADRTGQTGNEAGGYGKRLRVGLHFTQPNLPGSLSKWHSAQTCYPSVRRKLLSSNFNAVKSFSREEHLEIRDALKKDCGDLAFLINLAGEGIPE